MFALFESRPFWALCALASTAAAAGLACSKTADSISPSSSNSCAFEMNGAFSEAVTSQPNCVSLDHPSAVDDAGAAPGWILSLDATAIDGSQILINVDLGETPTSGSYSSDTIRGAWFASIDNRLDSGVEAIEAAAYGGWSAQCVYVAGAQWVPSGSFTLQLNSVTTSGTASAHGSFSATTYEHAPTAGNCGASEVENVVVKF